jgi:hypothetical protein
MDTNYKYLLLILFLFFGSNTNSLSQQFSAEINALTEGADVILIGKVSKQNSRWNEDKSRIYTDVSINVDEYLKGNYNQKTILITHPGGEVGEVGELYTHMPTFKEEEEILLFVKKNLNDEKYRVYAGEKGKIQIIKDKYTGEKNTALNKKVSDIKALIKSQLEK